MHLIDQRVVMIAGENNDALRTMAARNHWCVTASGPVEILLEKTDRRQVQIVVVHITEPDDSGLELIRRIRTHWRPPHCLVIALISNTALERAAASAGASCYFTSLEQLEGVVLALLSEEIPMEFRNQTRSPLRSPSRVPP